MDECGELSDKGGALSRTEHCDARRMSQATIVYWRDIPAQVIVGRGRTASKRELSKRFIAAIDRCAMRVGARDSDQYLAQWRRGDAIAVAGDANAEADRIMAEIEATYDDARLARMIAGDGYDQT